MTSAERFETYKKAMEAALDEMCELERELLKTNQRIRAVKIGINILKSQIRELEKQANPLVTVEVPRHEP